MAAQLAWKPPSKADMEAFRRATNRRQIDTFPGTGPGGWKAIAHDRVKREDWHEPEGYVAPSWSWAHLRGPISYLLCMPHTPFVSYVDVVEAKTIPVSPNEPTGQLSSGFITIEGYMVRGLQFTAAQAVYDDSSVGGYGFLNYKGTDDFFIEFEADDCSAMIRKRDSPVPNLVILLLGTKDFAPPEGGKGVAAGMSSPTQMSKSAWGIDEVVSAQLESPHLGASPPAEVRKAFAKDYTFARWSTYLVLAESLELDGKHERIGCFDVSVSASKNTEIMEALFCYSVKNRITII